MNRCLVLALLSSFGVWNTATHAQVVEYSFTGSISSSNGTFFGLTPQVGDPVTGYLRYDLSSVDDVPDPQVSRFAQLPPSVYDLYIDGTHFSSEGKFFTYVQNDNAGADVFQVGDGDSVANSGGLILVNGVAQVGGLGLELATFSMDAFTSDALPTNLNLASFTTREGNAGTGPIGAVFTINTLTRVPEPGTGVLLLMTTSLFVVRRKRK